MKNIILLLTMLVAFAHFAQADEITDIELETELESLMDGEEVMAPEVRTFAASEKAPAPFQDSDIKRTLNNGQTQKFDGNRYMIVLRGKKSKPAKPTIIIKEKKVVKYKNRVSLLAGCAPDGDLSRENGKVYTEHDLTMGLQYQRLINDRVNIGIQIQTNESVLGSVGLDF